VIIEVYAGSAQETDGLPLVVLDAAEVVGAWAWYERSEGIDYVLEVHLRSGKRLKARVSSEKELLYAWKSFVEQFRVAHLDLDEVSERGKRVASALEAG